MLRDAPKTFTCETLNYSRKRKKKFKKASHAMTTVEVKILKIDSILFKGGTILCQYQFSFNMFLPITSVS